MSMFVFQDQTKFMKACNQSVDVYDEKQTVLYGKLVQEEATETLAAIVKLPLAGRQPTVEQVAEVADGALDTIVVCIGLLRSLGLDPQPLWNEIIRSNMEKVDKATGKVLKREDGKVLKPTGWTPPDLASIVRQQMEANCD